MPQGPILVVDDEPINLDAMRLALGAVHKLIYARDGGSALEAIARHKPSLVLLDIRMPGMDGYEVCRAIKANPATGTCRSSSSPASRTWATRPGASRPVAWTSS